MSKQGKENKISYLVAIKQLLDPLYVRLERIDSKIKGNYEKSTLRYYRNEDLKKIFGLSNNTIIKYRQTGILPYTKLGDIFLYEATKIEKILNDNGQ
ncbi:helix-turn-helix domain-containing protein [Flavobacterium sp. ZT3R18]|uniref:DNA-binding protein n=1 Tax=Flavobacterium laiguense TaxID=2169409 RepID=A0A2U1JZ12_9FLAO|nr:MULTISPECIES: DNA-binding protein [Flavobacterium]PWA10467.1 DNA-binding protein [Flavobacterium laiguense]TRX30265.1 helix-turn-helix domain-containing protein [Flavobacterium sp. ZT3R18]